METSPAPWVRWLAVPAIIVMLALAALAIAGEGRDEFVLRNELQEQQEQQEQQAQGGSSGEGGSSSGQSQGGQSQGGSEGSGSGGGGSGGSGSGGQLQPVDPYPADRLIIQTENGPVELSLNGNDVQGRSAPGSGGGGGLGTDGGAITLAPDPNGNIVGFRIDEDGNFVPVEQGESTEGLTLLVPQDDGSFLLIRPDGTEIELYYTQNGLEARVDDGESYALEAEDGSVRVDDLVMTPLERGQQWNPDDFQQLPPDGVPELEDGERGSGQQVTPEDHNQQADPNDPAADDSADDSAGSTNWRNILIIVLLAVGIALAIWWFFAFRPRRVEEDEVPAPMLAPVVPGMTAWEAFEAFLAELAADPDPTHAIRLAFAYAEQGMGGLPSRESDETPYEWLTRTRSASPELASALSPLVDRYSDIRFGSHVATGAERDQALVELRALVSLAMSPAPAAAPA